MGAGGDSAAPDSAHLLLELFPFRQRSCWMLLGCCLGFEHCSSRRQRGGEAREDPGLQELL